MFLTEFPHDVNVIKEIKTIDNKVYPPKEVVATEVKLIKAFMDTPTTSQKVEYHSLGQSLSRMMYAPFNVDIARDSTIEFDGVKYKIIGDAEDQGGQHEVNRYPLERV